MKKQIALGIMALVLAQLPALPSQAETCEGNFCEVSFQFSGEITTWEVPAGVSEVNFEVAGASGGRGGQGGKVTGTLTDLPETLYIAVGGIGAIGSEVAGGFNGGGTSGGYRTNEGSGGGASDIRFGPELSDRVVVAGGGGGGGGFSGAPGGAGGGLEAASGQSGQGGGGKGGLQTAGGDAGVSNGGGAATPGVFGFGGSGGSAPNAGGGGGGGGWFGGGGGGADEDNCCTDGGGGGGGSSYANPNHTQQVEHQAGVQLGDGYIRFSYQKVQSVKSFSAGQVGQQIEFKLDLVLPQALEVTDFDLTGLSCESLELIDGGTKQRAVATQCQHGFQELEIASTSLVTDLGTDLSKASVFFDALAPVMTWELLEQDHLAKSAIISFTLSESPLSTDFFTVAGCDSMSVAQGQIVLSGCTEEAVRLTVEAGALADEFGNLGPAQTQNLDIEFDFLGPEITTQALVVDQELGTHEISLGLSEPATLDVERVEFTGPIDCVPTIEQGGILLSLSGSCGVGDYSYLIPEGSLIDAVGNRGLIEALAIEFAIAEPEPEPEPIIESPESQQPVNVQDPEPLTPDENVDPAPVVDDEATEVVGNTPTTQEPEPTGSNQPGNTADEEVPEQSVVDPVQPATGPEVELTPQPSEAESPQLPAEPTQSNPEAGVEQSESGLPIEKVTEPRRENSGLSGPYPVMEITEAERMRTITPGNQELSQPAFVEAATDFDYEVETSQNLLWLGPLGLLVVGISAFFGWRLIGK